MSAQPSQADLVYLHKSWIGYVQPQGLVVTAAVLADAWIFPPRDLLDLQERFVEFTTSKRQLPSFQDFAATFLDWTGDLAAWGEGVPPDLAASIDGQAILPSFVVRDMDSGAPLVLGLSVDPSRDLDGRATRGGRAALSPHQTLEKLLWETRASIGIVENRRAVRLVFAPRGESVGHATFTVDDMVSTAGRPVLGALLMLLSARRLEPGDPDKRLPGLLQKSREYQSTVSAALREQVLVALGALLRGFEEADARADHTLLPERLRREGMRHVYAGLVTVIMRLVFLLYAEEKGLLPLHDPLYAEGYSLRRLFDRLESDRELHGATLQQRFGAWARLVSLFRLLHGGVHAASGLALPARRGDLFDPERYRFLEGRDSARQSDELLDLPRVSDQTVLDVLSSLALYKGERLMYRGLDVEHIGGVYEGLMGFDVLSTDGRSVCLLPLHVVVNLDDLARMSGPDRVRFLKSEAGVDLKDKAAAAVRDAHGGEGLFAVLSGRVSARRPGMLSAGTLVLQPGQERRRTGSHYTPRALTKPIVETALRPIWERLGPEATPEQILDLKICDPAMGSGAFLVEACRQVADNLDAAWRRTETTPPLPADEDALLHARRLVAQKCLYGVDKNPLAVDLARVSLWLETFAADHPFTFVDHALRCGDSLVGLSREQIFNLSFEPAKGHRVSEQARNQLYNAVRRAEMLRGQIHAIGDPPDNDRLDQLWDQANHALSVVRTIGDAMVASYFEGDTDKARKNGLDDLRVKALAWLQKGEHAADIDGMVKDLREGEKPVPVFHWEVEFPEVFSRKNGGFDCLVGNPPFLGGTMIGGQLGLRHHDFLIDAFAPSTGNVDIVAFFLRNSFGMARRAGTVGLIATNTIAQGDTRIAGLQQVLEHGGTIYEAQRRYKWPGQAAVVISVIHLIRETDFQPAKLDGATVSRITAFLLSGTVDSRPVALSANRGVSFVGSQICGSGFLFEELPSRGASSLVDMERMLKEDPTNRDVIVPYIGGEEFNFSSTQSPSRFIIDFGTRAEAEARRWPALFGLVEERVKPLRATNKQKNYREDWWLHATRVPEATEYLRKHGRLLALTQVSKHLATAFLGEGIVFAKTIVLLLIHHDSGFSIIQSRVHEAWVRFLGSSMKDDLRYTPSDCFENFPFPPPGDPRTLNTAHPALESIGQRYYDFRAALMIRHDEGLTKTYNHLHDPEDTRADIVTLRALHAEMDRAVLDAYGWPDIRPTYDFRTQLDESTRYTWDDATRDEVLGRLLDLNRRYAEEEAAAAKAAAEQAAWEKARSRDTPPPAPGAPPTPARKPRGKKSPPDGQGNLF